MQIKRATGNDEKTLLWSNPELGHSFTPAFVRLAPLCSPAKYFSETANSVLCHISRFSLPFALLFSDPISQHFIIRPNFSLIGCLSCSVGYRGKQGAMMAWPTTPAWLSDVQSSFIRPLHRWSRVYSAISVHYSIHRNCIGANGEPESACLKTIHERHDGRRITADLHLHGHFFCFDLN